MTSSEIRRQFIDFFVQRHGHTFVPSSPVVPHDDPTLLFTNAGMNQFKPIFLGTERRAYTRAVNTQKCIRAGGKHNDLDDVGRSRRHHTFFEMLGNWSFGDYFKQEAIAWSWELLTKVWQLDPARLHVTVHAGDPAIGVDRDDEAARVWREVCGVPADHIHYGNTKDNFWEMGETGPCGPCTEIFVDRTPDKTGGPSVLSGDDPRVMEIWNNVFIQYNRNPDKSLTVLPAQHVDTGMGLERIIQVLQGKDDNYGIDLFDPFWAKLKELSGINYTGRYPKSNTADPVAEAADAQLRHDIAFRVIADHIRCLTIAMTDGADPDKEGRGYVLRRILRRAVRFGRQQLGLKDPFLHKLVPVVVDTMGEAFPELAKTPQRVAEIIKDEEVSFGRTLERGLLLFEDAATRVIANAYAARFHPGKTWSSITWSEGEPGGDGEKYSSEPSWVLVVDETTGTTIRVSTAQAVAELQRSGHPSVPLSGDDAFKLQATFGFPIDLTQVMANERGLVVDMERFNQRLKEHQETSRGGGPEGESRLLDLPPDAIAKLQAQKVVPTDDSPKFNAAPVGATVKAIWNGRELIDRAEGSDTPVSERTREDPDGLEVRTPSGSSRVRSDTGVDSVAVILDRTCFYAEMGGQVGDEGTLAAPGTLFAVTTARAVGGYVLHIGELRHGAIKVGTEVEVTVDRVLRPRTEQNHTTTHLANWALREVLGDAVQQKGSLVDPEKLRFDFSHPKALTDEEVGRAEQLVNASIGQKLKVYAEEAPQEQALKINGLRAVFGEKYPERVRVVSVGVPVADLLTDPPSERWRQFSVEFCGGTHLRSTDEAGAFVIAAEESVSKGIRRIVAHTGDAAKQIQAANAEVEQLLTKAQQAKDDQLAPMLHEVQKSFAVSPIGLRTRRKAQAAVADLQAKLKAYEKAQKQSSAAAVDVAGVAEPLLAAATPIGPGKLVVGEVPGGSADAVQAVADSLKKRAGSYAVLLGGVADGKVSFVAAVSDDVIKLGLKAGDWIREAAKVAGGGGGGRPQHAQAGGKNPAKLGEALEVARAFAARFAG